MSEEQKGFMEGVIKAGSKSAGIRREEEGERPTIALKMNFGG